MFSTSRSALIAPSLHSVFAGTSHGLDSIELWLAVAAEAERQLRVPVLETVVRCVPVFVRYQLVRTEGEFFPFSGSVRITSGPLTGTAYIDPDTAARAVIAATVPLIGHGDTGDGDEPDTTESAVQVPSWRFRGVMAATTPPLIS